MRPSPHVDVEPIAARERTKQRVYRIIDVYEVARLLATTEDLRILASDDRRCERGDDAIFGALTQSVHVCSDQRGELHCVHLAIHPECLPDRLRHQLRHSRGSGFIPFLHRQSTNFHLAVDECCRKERHHLAYSMVTGCLEHTDRHVERLQAVAQTSCSWVKGSEMHDQTWPPQTDEFSELDRRRIEMVKPQLPAHRTRFGKIGERSSREVVHYVHGKRLRQQTLDEMRTDESSTSDDEHRSANFRQPRTTSPTSSRLRHGRHPDV